VRDEQLYAFVADARARGAADLRRRTRWLHQQLRQDAGFVDVCRDLAMSGVPVEVSLADGRRHRGRLTGVGADTLAVGTTDGATMYVTTAAVAGLRAVTSTPGRLGDGDGSEAGGPAPLESHLTDGVIAGGTLRDGQRFSDVLGDLADLRASVVAGTATQQTFCGVLAGVGRDVVWFDDNQWYVRLQAITDVTILP
jgi:hypothetical protein